MAKITIDKSCCKGCNICLSTCPKGIFVKSKKRGTYGTNIPETAKTESCILCKMCIRLCPDGAIQIEEEEF